MKSASKKKLYEEVVVLLGGGVLDIPELNEQVFDTYTRIAIEDYTSMINEWLLVQQWHNLQGLKIDNANFVYALTTKSLDYEQSFAYAYSKQTGAGQNPDWELKRDYVEISANTQVYTIPAGREVNEVLWYTPSQMFAGFAPPFDGLAWTAEQWGWSIGGVPAATMLPNFSHILAAHARSMKRKMFQSELTYKISPGKNGTKQLFLYPLPGSRWEISGRNGKTRDGDKVWYFYYDTNEQGRDKCLEENNDIIKFIDEVPYKDLEYDKLNTMSKSRIRRLLVAKLKQWIGLNRGKFSGTIAGTKSGGEKKMDYDMYLSKGVEEESKLAEEVKASLDKLSYGAMMEERAKIAENLNNVLKYTVPFQQFYSDM